MNIGFSKTTNLRFEGRMPYTWDRGSMTLWPKAEPIFFGLCGRKSLQFGRKIVNALGVCVFFRFRFGCIFTKCETFSTRIRLPIHIFITPKRWEAEYIICIKKKWVLFLEERGKEHKFWPKFTAFWALREKPILVFKLNLTNYAEWSWRNDRLEISYSQYLQNLHAL